MSANLSAQLIVAHRGASHDAPENTLAAFQLAWAQQADGIEGDFRLTKDGQIVCIHDATTERTAGVDWDVATSTLAELKKLDVGRWKGEPFAGQRIPTLQEVMETVPEGKQIVIELKVGPEIIRPLQSVLNDSKMQPGQILVIGFDEKTVRESKRLLPHIKTHWLTGYKEDEPNGSWSPDVASVAASVARCNADGLGSKADRHVFNQDFVKSLATAGINEFHIWTVDDPADARYYQALGACSITTNRPEFLRQALALKTK